jgi:hypothetical protein
MGPGLAGHPRDHPNPMSPDAAGGAYFKTQKYGLFGLQGTLSAEKRTTIAHLELITGLAD